VPRLLERSEVIRHLAVEIRSDTRTVPPMAGDLQRLGVSLLDTSRLLSFSGAHDLSPEAIEALLDPECESIATPSGTAEPYVDVFYLPGVTDAEGEMAGYALSLAGVPHDDVRAGMRWRFAQEVPAALRPRVERIVGNPVVHGFSWSDDPATPHESAADPIVPAVKSIGVSGLDDTALAALSAQHGLALDVDEMRAVQGEFDALGRAPTDVELQSIALAWSEHCSHKTFKASIEMTSDGKTEQIDGLLRDCIVAPSTTRRRWWVRSSFADNAGVIALDAHHDLAIKVETHNHPSAIEPYGGAHTGVGGVIRDVLAMSAEPIANLDVLCFGRLDTAEDDLPAGVLHPRITLREVVRGVADYGNNMGIPTVSGAIYFHRGYTANPLVFCGTVGIAPRDAHPNTPASGDLIVVLGGHTGRDGLHGATMSSGTLHREAVAASSVQIGDPIVEKRVRDVLPSLRDERLYSAITDCGAGGLCSAVGEMGEALGVEVDLSLVPLKYPGLAPWEIWLSEAQERMVLAVPPECLPRLQELCGFHGVDASVIGRLRGDRRLVLRHGDTPVGNISTALLYDGHPRRNLSACWDTLAHEPAAWTSVDDPEAALLVLLGDPTIGSKERVVRRYDQHVGARTAQGPLAGLAGPADAAVLRPLPDSTRGVVLALGMAPLATALDPYEMAMLAVDEALRNLVAVGGSIGRAALLDNFCWGDVDDPESLGTLVRAAQGCRDAARRYRVPFISGKDSLRNTSADAAGRHSISGTLLITALGVVPNAAHCISMNLKTAGNTLYAVGVTDGAMGASYLEHLLGRSPGILPATRAETPEVMRRLTRAIRRGVVQACHDLSEGGVAVAAAEMAIAGGLGLSLELERLPAETDQTDALLFAETPGRFLVEVRAADEARFEAALAGTPLARLGEVREEPHLTLVHHGRPAIDVPLNSLNAAWRGAL
jgi:phosphoribosylformylglycinamidine synthase II